MNNIFTNFFLKIYKFYSNILFVSLFKKKFLISKLIFSNKNLNNKKEKCYFFEIIILKLKKEKQKDYFNFL